MKKEEQSVHDRTVIDNARACVWHRHMADHSPMKPRAPLTPWPNFDPDKLYLTRATEAKA